jgi:hypothetical protein
MQIERPHVLYLVILISLVIIYYIYARTRYIFLSYDSQA